MGSVGFPAGFYGISALAVHLNSLPLYTFSQIAIGGVGFYCLYPQIPPHLSTKWFADRKGLVVSLYFTVFGSSLALSSIVIHKFLAMVRASEVPIPGANATS